MSPLPIEGFSNLTLDCDEEVYPIISNVDFSFVSDPLTFLSNLLRLNVSKSNSLIIDILKVNVNYSKFYQFIQENSFEDYLNFSDKTLFAPDNKAFEKAEEDLRTLPREDQLAVLQNHLLNVIIVPLTLHALVGLLIHTEDCLAQYTVVKEGRQVFLEWFDHNGQLKKTRILAHQDAIKGSIFTIDEVLW